jgi:release factor glutamine methyltransferase
VNTKDLLKRGKELLAAKDIGGVDAELLLAFVLGINRMELHAKSIDVNEDDIEQFEHFLDRRITGEPTQYIMGTAPFRYLEYQVGPGVLIPRPETELLVDEVLHHVAALPDPISVVDLGSGSGAIAISIASETLGKKNVHVVAVEKSTEAADWLNKNIALHDVNVRVVVEDVTTALDGVKCDVVVANPPYVPDDAILPTEVKREPAEALFGGDATGMEIPKVFISAAARLLKPGGFLAMEHGEHQEAAIQAALGEHFERIRTHRDLNERPRFTTAFLKL